jgi:hypothetical protein
MEVGMRYERAWRLDILKNGGAQGQGNLPEAPMLMGVGRNSRSKTLIISTSVYRCTIYALSKRHSDLASP